MDFYRFSVTLQIVESAEKAKTQSRAVCDQMICAGQNVSLFVSHAHTCPGANWLTENRRSARRLTEGNTNKIISGRRREKAREMKSINPFRVNA